MRQLEQFPEYWGDVLYRDVLDNICMALFSAGYNFLFQIRGSNSDPNMTS